VRFEEEDTRIEDARGVSLQVLITAAEFLLGPTGLASTLRTRLTPGTVSPTMLIAQSGNRSQVGRFDDRLI